MPNFTPGALKTAVVQIPVSPAGLSCQAVLFLGPDASTVAATSGEVAFVSTGNQQQISLLVVMPANIGTYHVYLGIYSEGALLTGFAGSEDVVIMSQGELLTVTDLTVNPATINVGQPVTIKASYINNNSFTLTGPFDFPIDSPVLESPVFWDYTTGLEVAPGESQELIREFTPQKAGIYTIRAGALSVPLEVTAFLPSGTATVNAYAPRLGQNWIVRASVYNTGEIPYTYRCVFSFADQTKEAAVTVNPGNQPPFGFTNSPPVTFAVPSQPGTYVIKLDLYVGDLLLYSYSGTYILK
ncbi:MAG: hypothetical protein PHI12_06890 [Dehalococcoidales bacterium]|nr:hypothetical protein [Dehalococcoidales bacterium]